MKAYREQSYHRCIGYSIVCVRCPLEVGPFELWDAMSVDTRPLREVGCDTSGVSVSEVG